MESKICSKCYRNKPLCDLQPLWATTREINGVVYEGNLNKNKVRRK